MAFSKNILRRNGLSGTYIAIRSFRVNYLSKEASVIFSLYASKQHAKEAPDSPLIPVYAKVRFEGSNFDEVFGKQASPDIRSSVYSAVRNGKTVICDDGSGVFGDAEDA